MSSETAPSLQSDTRPGYHEAVAACDDLSEAQPWPDDLPLPARFEDLAGFFVPAHRIGEYLGTETISRREHERRRDQADADRRQKLFFRTYPQWDKTERNPAWYSQGVNLHNRSLRAEKERMITRLACFLCTAVRKGHSASVEALERLYKRACTTVLGEEHPAASPRKRAEWRTRVLKKAVAFLGAREASPPPVTRVYDRNLPPTEKSKRTAGKRPSPLSWKRPRAGVGGSRSADSPPPAAPGGALGKRGLPSPPSPGNRTAPLPPLFVGLMRSKLHLFEACHWRGCRVEFSPGHVLSWGAKQLETGRRLDDLIRAYDAAVVRWHGRATDAGCRGAWHAGGLMADLYGHPLPVMDVTERAALKLAAAEGRKRRALWRSMLRAARPEKTAPVADAVANPYAAMLDGKREAQREAEARRDAWEGLAA